MDFLKKRTGQGREEEVLSHRNCKKEVYHQQKQLRYTRGIRVEIDVRKTGGGRGGGTVIFQRFRNKEELPRVGSEVGEDGKRKIPIRRRKEIEKKKSISKKGGGRGEKEERNKQRRGGIKKIKHLNFEPLRWLNPLKDGKLGQIDEKEWTR